MGRSRNPSQRTKVMFFAGEVERVLSAYPQRTSAHVPEHYIGGGQSKLRFLGVRSPDLRKALREGFSFSAGSSDAVATAWDQVWRESDCFEVMALALAWFDHRQRRGILLAKWPMLRKWSAKVDNWAHADVLSGLYARILEQAPERVYPTLKKWNASRNPWLRRLSIVSLLYYSSQREVVLPFPRLVALIEPQLDQGHHFIQRGVGWALRETGNVYPRETFRFLEKNASRLSSIAFSAATEKLAKGQKEQLKALRRSR